MFKISTKKKMSEQLDFQYNQGIEKGRLLEREHEQKRKDEYRSLAREEIYNQYIIGVSNEYTNPYIGKVKGFLDINSDIPIIDDLVSNQEIAVMGAYKLYTPQLFHALMKLEPEERAALMFNHYYNGREVAFNKTLPCVETMLSKTEIIERLESNGFVV